jgi:hypothetical protein
MVQHIGKDCCSEPEMRQEKATVNASEFKSEEKPKRDRIKIDGYKKCSEQSSICQSTPFTELADENLR